MVSKTRFVGALILPAVAVGLYLFVSYPLARFARRIASADRVVVSMKQGAVSINILGDDAKRVIQAVSSAKGERPPWGMSDACIYDVKITFFKGSEALGDILSCTQLFIVSGKKYRDETGDLGRLAVSPAHAAYVDWERRQLGPGVRLK